MVRRMMAALGIGIALLIPVATSASAHDTSLAYRGNSAGVDNNHQRVRVSDRGCTRARPVFVQFQGRTTWGAIYTARLNAPCGGLAFRNEAPRRVIRYRLCETTIGCSAWKAA
jgi:hypothetical protein